MYYEGYATLKMIDKDSQMVTIGSPNKDIRALLQSDLCTTVFTNYSLKHCQEIYRCLIAKNAADLKTRLRSLIGESTSYYYLKKDDSNEKSEALYHDLIQFSFKVGGSKDIHVISEVATNLERINSVVIDPGSKSIFIIEVRGV